MKKTPLHQTHIDLGARMGEFAGYDMPLFYKEGVIKEHEWVRNRTGLFDVSHMGQIILEGPGVVDFLERITPSSFAKKKPGRAQYTVLTNNDGGIIDDLIVTRMGENKFFAVINAGCKDKDIEWIKRNLPDNVKLTHLEDRALLALQGGWAERIIYEIFKIDTHDLPYMHMIEAEALYGTPLFISRLGYTGEDGFEISVPNDKAKEIWDKLEEHSEVKPIGLAARDSLRLEMGYPLYGHDIDETTSPVEADIAWIIGKDNKNFIGAPRILKEMERGPERKRVGVKLTDKGVAREGAEIYQGDKKIGALTSGGFSPHLKESIGMGYVTSEHAIEGAEIAVDVRGRKIAAQICAMPFVAPKTKSVKKSQAA